MTSKISSFSLPTQLSTLSLQSAQAQNFISLCAANKLQEAQGIYDSFKKTPQILATALEQACETGSVDTTLWLRTLRIKKFAPDIILNHHLPSVIDKVLSSGNNSERQKLCDAGYADAIFKAFKLNEQQHPSRINQAGPYTRYFANFCISGNLEMLQWLHEQNPTRLEAAFFSYHSQVGATNPSARGIDLLWICGHIPCLDWIQSLYPRQVYIALFIDNPCSTLFYPIRLDAVNDLLPRYQWIYNLYPQPFIGFLKHHGLCLFREALRTHEDFPFLLWLHTITEGKIIKPLTAASDLPPSPAIMHAYFFQMFQEQYFELALSLVPWLQNMEDDDTYPAVNWSDILRTTQGQSLFMKYMEQASDLTLASILINLENDTTQGTESFWRSLPQPLIDKSISAISQEKADYLLINLYQLAPDQVVDYFYNLLRRASTIATLEDALGDNFTGLVRWIYWSNTKIRHLVHTTPILKETFAFSENLWPYLTETPSCNSHPLDVTKLLTEHQSQLLVEYCTSTSLSELAMLLQSAPESTEFISFWQALDVFTKDKGLQALCEHGTLSSLLQFYAYTPGADMSFLRDKLVSSSAQEILDAIGMDTDELIQSYSNRTHLASGSSAIPAGALNDGMLSPPGTLTGGLRQESASALPLIVSNLIDCEPAGIADGSSPFDITVINPDNVVEV